MYNELVLKQQVKNILCENEEIIMNCADFESQLKSMVNQNNLIKNCYEDVIKDCSGCIHVHPNVNFLKITDSEHIAETVNYFINVKHFLDDNLDIGALKTIDKWFDVRRIIWNWQYDTTFFLLSKKIYEETLQKAFPKNYLNEEKVYFVYDELLTSFYSRKENTSEPVRCFTDIYGEKYYLYVEAYPSSLDGDALYYYLSGIKGKWLWHN